MIDPKNPEVKQAAKLEFAKPPVEPLVLQAGPPSSYSTATSEIFHLFRGYQKSAKQYHLNTLAFGLVIVLLVNMVGQVYLNRWQGSFFSAIEAKHLPTILDQLWLFMVLVAVLLAVVVSQTWLHMRLQISLREWLTRKLLGAWLSPATAYRLGISSDTSVNPDQRIQEDVRNFAVMSTDLAVGLFQASLLLVSFIGVLWAMSQNIVLSWGDQSFSIPGYMVWVAILYSALGSWLTGLVGRPLISLNEDRYMKEANFRFSIMRASESAESIAFYSGEKDEQQVIEKSLSRVLKVMLKVSFATAKLTWITSGYGWLMIVLPVMMALPGYLSGSLNLGGLMMVVGAFNQVQQSLRWFVDNFARIADWRAALHRVAIFQKALEHLDDFELSEQIEVQPHPEGLLQFDRTKVILIDGEVVIADATATIHPGERILIQGESGSGKSTLLRAVSGMWPWGSGRILIPPKADMMFLPQRPYIPLGSLAHALTYPRGTQDFEHGTLIAALRRVNLEDFIPMLHREERWDQLMSLGQQQRLAFARLLIHRPKWIFLDEATSALDDDNQHRMMSLFITDLAGSSLMSIGHRPGLAEYHTRNLHLVTTQAGTILQRRPPAPKKGRIWQRIFKRPVKDPNPGAPAEL